MGMVRVIMGRGENRAGCGSRDSGVWIMMEVRGKGGGNKG